MKEKDVRLGHQKEIVYRQHDYPENSYTVFIGYHAPDEIFTDCDEVTSLLMPPQENWNAYLDESSQTSYGSGWHSNGVAASQLERLANETDSYKKAKEIAARSTVRPVIIASHPQNLDRSPAQVAKRFIEDYIDLDQTDEQQTL